MLRTFETHKIRKYRELSGRLWKFIPLSGEQANQEHYGSYTIFDACCCNISEGEHELQILVNNEFKEEYALDIPNDYMSYGGISRGVLLEEVPDVFIKWIHVTPICNEEGIWKAKIEICCVNLQDKEEKMDISLLLAEEEYSFENRKICRGESIAVSEDIEISNVEEWSLNHPRLYEAQVILSADGKEIDDLIDRVGFRTVRVEGERILLNETPVFIKGFCRHEDHPHYG